MTFSELLSITMATEYRGHDNHNFLATFIVPMNEVYICNEIYVMGKTGCDLLRQRYGTINYEAAFTKFVQILIQLYLLYTCICYYRNQLLHCSIST